MAFTSRSSLRDTLTKLLLYDMVITEDALVKCLVELKVLLELFIQDVVVSFSECCLITDSLLRRLFWRDDTSCLVPHLHRFSFCPLFQFGANTFAKFVDSRLGKASNGPFTIQAFYAEDNFFDDSTLAYMTALHAEGRLRWSLQDREILRQKLADIHLF
ncbi:hypothetical protein MSAN_01623300 [Mycena sanguinolenta]|uniref:Uncharacterized protein n=1 Tax=Mycena sanguinolenta TaxID=230812 RepID=A0A8H6Y265_9AGAR|nr:hypothetical protein MSAN_01623300 [Mycena sanguinolenta]